MISYWHDTVVSLSVCPALRVGAGVESRVPSSALPCYFLSEVIGCEDRLRNDLYCVGWGVKLYSIQSVTDV